MNPSHPTYKLAVDLPSKVDPRPLRVDQMTTIHGTRRIFEVPPGENLSRPSPPMMSTCPHENSVSAICLEVRLHSMLCRKPVIVKRRLHRLPLWATIPTLDSLKIRDL
jgi:hypothetical protein